jgi:hypothetical protein
MNELRHYEPGLLHVRERGRGHRRNEVPQARDVAIALTTDELDSEAPTTTAYRLSPSAPRSIW